MSDRPAYPRRDSFFGQQVVRLLTKVAVANQLGPHAFTLLAVVAAQQDAVYGRSVSYFNDQLLPLVGLRKVDSLAGIRKECQAAGWLEYTPPPAGTRKAGLYKIIIPASVAHLSDSACDEGDQLVAEYLRGYADGVAGRQSQPYPLNGHHTQLTGAVAGAVMGNHQSSPSPSPSTSCPAPLGGDFPLACNKSKRKRRKLHYSPEDLALVEWFWGLILEMQPGRKPPKLEKWADEIRLMRERDGRSHEEIRGLIDRIQGDKFWRTNVLCPETLREKWDNLTLKLGVSPAGLARSSHPLLGRRPPSNVASNGKGGL